MLYVSVRVANTNFIVVGVIRQGAQTHNLPHPRPVIIIWYVHSVENAIILSNGV